jgi:lambda family phage tail tape measure protein
MAEATVTRVIEVDVRASAAAQAHLKEIAEGMKSLDKTAQDAKEKMSSWGNSVGGWAKSMVAFFMADKVREFAVEVGKLNDAQKILSERMKLVIGDSANARKAFQDIIDVSQRSGIEFETVGKLYEKILRQQGNFGISTRGITLLTEGLASSLRLSGAGTQEAQATMLQFSQALAAGKLAGDEFRSMMENDSVFMYELAKAAGVTSGELKKMAKDGKIDLEFLQKALFNVGEDGKNMLQRLNEQAGKLPMSFAQAFNGAKAAFADLLNALGEGADKMESIWTRAMRAIDQNLRDKARQTRENNYIQDQIDQAMGKAGAGKLSPQEKPHLDQFVDKHLERIDQLQKEILKSQKDIEEFGSKADPRTVLREREKIKMYEAEERAIRNVLQTYKDEANDQYRPAYVVGKPQASTGTPDKKKRGEDPFFTYKDELLKFTSHAEQAAEGIGKWEQKLEDALAKSTLKPTASLKAAIANIRAQAREVDQAAAKEEAAKTFMADRVKESDERVAKSNARQKEDWSEFETGWKALQKAIRKDDPLMELEEQEENLRHFLEKFKELPGVAAEVEKGLHAVRETWAKKLMGDNAKDVKNYSKEVQDMFKGSTDRMIDNLLEFNKSGKEIIRDFVTDFLKQVAKMEIQKQMASVTSGFGTMIGNGLAELFGAAQAKGGAWNNGVQMFARGGVVNSPTGFGMAGGGMGVMGEAGPEAIMPLRRGGDGKLGVGTAPVNVTVINNANGTKATTQESTNSKGEKQITIMVEELVEQGLGSGRFDKVLGNSFGVGRKGKG